jgi:aspartyl-tRNA(Asn)/glutamyl-tRNA(Gln) amidotransferase subunit C
VCTSNSESVKTRSLRVSLSDVRRVSDLANVGLTVEEESRMQRDLDMILSYVDQLAEVDTTGIEPMTQVNFCFQEQRTTLIGGDTLRPDVIQPSLDRSEVMAQAPETDGRFFKVPRVIER